MKNWSLNNILGLLFCFLLFPVVVTGIGAYVYTLESLKEERQKSGLRFVNNIAAQSIKKITEHIELSIGEMQIAIRKAISDEKTEEINKIVFNVLNSSRFFVQSVIAINNLPYQIHPEPIARPVDFKPEERPWYPHTGKRGEIVYSTVYDSGHPHKLKDISLATSIFDFGGERVGAVAFDLDMEYFSTFLNNVQSPFNADIAVTDANGVVVMHSDRKKIMKDRLRADWFTKTKGITGVFYSPETEEFVYYHAVQQPDWYVFLIVPKEKHEQTINQWKRNYFFASSCFLVIYLLFSIICQLIFSKAIMGIKYGLNNTTGNEATFSIDTITSELNNKNERIIKSENSAFRDELTGLFNRSKFEQDIAKLAEENNSIQLGIIDLDNFKNINDSYGHPIGDMVLSFIGKSIQARRKEGLCAYRYGGEEFVFIFTEGNQAEAVYYLEELRKQVARRRWREEGLHVTFSAGVTEGSSSDFDNLLNVADKLLYKAKKSGKNRIVSGDSTDEENLPPAT